ncbi:MAG: RDD family protein [Pseudomonadota bacterium]|nr:RDD family protein [Pseudomonadota bacterium]
MPSDQNYPTAPLTRRLAALAYDGLILVALYIILGGLLVTLISKLAEGGDDMLRLSPATAASLFYIICFLYYSHSWRRGGQTVGMKSWRIKVISEYKPEVTLSQCMLRSAIGFFSILAAGLGFLWMLFDKKQQTWHDKASMTRVIYLPKNMD